MSADSSSSSVTDVRQALTTSPRRLGERIVLKVLFACGAVSILTTLALIAVLLVESSVFFRSEFVGVTEFLTGTRWTPFGNPESASFAVGVLPLLNGTLLVTAIAMVVAVPLGLAAAIYLSEYARPRVRRVVKPTLELLAGVPTVVLGYFALTFFTPAVLRPLFGNDVQIFNALSAGVIMGVMIVPTIASLSEDAMTAVPQALREGSYGMGATRWTTVRQVILPASLSGIVAAVILGFGRAIGETMIVAIAAGNLPSITGNPLDQVQTMTAYIVQAVTGEAPRGSLTFQSIFAVGLLLFALTFLLNLLAQAFVRRYREVY